MTDELIKTNLEDIGYDNFFDLKWKSFKLANCSVARVIAEHKEAYKVKDADGEYLAKITGKQIFNARKREDYPAVGDWVVITKLDKEKSIIQSVLSRKTILQKKYSGKQDIQIIATNIDVAFIVESLDRDYNLNRFERYFVLASEGGIKSVIILNKIDLVSKVELDKKVKQIKNRFDGIDVILTSAIDDQGLIELENYIKKGKTYCFLGSSGVGKSSLVNKLVKKNVIKTREVSDSTGRGKHTTTAREMYFLKNGGIVIDNPGTREVGVADTNSGLENVFDEITSLSKKCRYVDCAHIHEPGCAVLEAIGNKKIDEDKYQNYIKLRKENEYFEMTNFEKRQKDRKFGRFLKKSLDELKEIES